MHFYRLPCLSATCFLALVQPARATITYSDGLTHSVSALSADIWLNNGSTLNVLHPAFITAPSGLPAILGQPPSHVVISGGFLNGGQVLGPSGIGGGSGVEVQGGSLTISGGKITGGDASFFISGQGVDVRNTQLDVSGGTIIGGDVFPTGAGAVGHGLQANGGTVHISGGTFTGGDGPNRGGSALVLAGGNAPVAVAAVITGGTFNAGHATPDFGLGTSVLQVQMATTLELRGGHFSGGGFYLGDNSVTNAYGHGWSSVPITGGRHISGTLQDGSSLSVDVNLGAAAVLNLIEVPEPSGLFLAVAGAGCLMVVLGHRKRRRAA